MRAGAFAPKIIAMTERFAGGAPLICGCFVRPTARLVIRAKGGGEPVGYSRRRRKVGRTERRDLISHLIKQVEQVRTRVFPNNEDWFAELRCRNARGGVIDRELDASPPRQEYVAAQMAGDVDRPPRGLGEKLAERRPGGPESDRRSRAVSSGSARVQRRCDPDRLGMRDADVRKGKARLRVSGAERRERSTDRPAPLRRRDRQCRIDRQLGDQRSRSSPSPAVRPEILAKRRADPRRP